MPLIRTTLTRLALLALGTFAALSFAQQDRRSPPTPPPEAYAACAGKTEGATVTLTMPDGKSLTGTCRTMGGTLVATPAGGPGGPGGAGGPPPAR